MKYSLSVNDALDSLFRHWYCLIILDLELRDVDGMKLLQTLREHHTIPVLVLSENSSVDAKTAMLLAGADDYLTKPFDERECLAKAQALIRRYTELGGLILESHTHCAWVELLSLTLNTDASNLREISSSYAERNLTFFTFSCSTAAKCSAMSSSMKKSGKRMPSLK